MKSDKLFSLFNSEQILLIIQITKGWIHNERVICKMTIIFRQTCLYDIPETNRK